MADIVDQATRSRMMAGIRSKDTKPELILRHSLHSRGLRYRIHARQLPGRPDVVFPRYRAVIFVHGCFWHRHTDCRFATIPATRSEFWKAKFAANVARDQAVMEALRNAGWRAGIVWECQLRNPLAIHQVAEAVEYWIKKGGNTFNSSDRATDMAVFRH